MSALPATAIGGDSGSETPPPSSLRFPSLRLQAGASGPAALAVLAAPPSETKAQPQPHPHSRRSSRSLRRHASDAGVVSGMAASASPSPSRSPRPRAGAGASRSPRKSQSALSSPDHHSAEATRFFPAGSPTARAAAAAAATTIGEGEPTLTQTQTHTHRRELLRERTVVPIGDRARHNPLHCERCWRFNPFGMMRMWEEARAQGIVMGPPPVPAAAAPTGAGPAPAPSASWPLGPPPVPSTFRIQLAGRKVAPDAASNTSAPRARIALRPRKIYHLPAASAAANSSVEAQQQRTVGVCTCAAGHGVDFAGSECNSCLEAGHHAAQCHSDGNGGVARASPTAVLAFLLSSGCTLLDEQTRALLQDQAGADAVSTGSSALVQAELDRLRECGPLTVHFLQLLNDDARSVGIMRQQQQLVAEGDAGLGPGSPVHSPGALTQGARPNHALSALVAALRRVCTSFHLRRRASLLEFLQRSVALHSRHGTAQQWRQADADCIMAESGLFERAHGALVACEKERAKNGKARLVDETDARLATQQIVRMLRRSTATTVPSSGSSSVVPLPVRSRRTLVVAVGREHEQRRDGKITAISPRAPATILPAANAASPRARLNHHARTPRAQPNSAQKLCALPAVTYTVTSPTSLQVSWAADRNPDLVAFRFVISPDTAAAGATSTATDATAAPLSAPLEHHVWASALRVSNGRVALHLPALKPSTRYTIRFFARSEHGWSDASNSRFRHTHVDASVSMPALLPLSVGIRHVQPPSVPVYLNEPVTPEWIRDERSTDREEKEEARTDLVKQQEPQDGDANVVHVINRRQRAVSARHRQPASEPPPMMHVPAPPSERPAPIPEAAFPPSSSNDDGNGRDEECSSATIDILSDESEQPLPEEAPPQQPQQRESTKPQPPPETAKPAAPPRHRTSSSTTILHFGGSARLTSSTPAVHAEELQAALQHVHATDASLSVLDGGLAVSQADRLAAMDLLSSASFFDHGHASFMEVAAADFDALIRAAGGVAGLAHVLQGLDSVGAKFAHFDELLPVVIEVQASGVFVTAAVCAELDSWLQSAASPFRIAAAGADQAIKLESCSPSEWETMVRACHGSDALLVVLGRLARGEQARTAVSSVGALASLVAEEQAEVEREDGQLAADHEERMDAARESVMARLCSGDCSLFADADLSEVTGDDLDMLLHLALPMRPEVAAADPQAPQRQAAALLAHLAAFDRVHRRFSALSDLVRAMESACPPPAKSTDDFVTDATDTDQQQGALLFNLDAVNLQRAHITIAARDSITATLTHPACTLMADPTRALQQASGEQWDALVALLLQLHPLLDGDGRIAGGLDGMSAASLVHHFRRLERRGVVHCQSISELINALQAIFAHVPPLAFKAQLVQLLMDPARCQLFGAAAPLLLSPADSQLDDLVWAVLGAQDAVGLALPSGDPQTTWEPALARMATCVLAASAAVAAGSLPPCRTLEEACVRMTGSRTLPSAADAASRPQTAAPNAHELQQSVRAAIAHSSLFSTHLLPPVASDREVQALARKDAALAANNVGAPRSVVLALQCMDRAGRKFDAPAGLIAACDAMLVDGCALAPDARAQIDELVDRLCSQLPQGAEYAAIVAACMWRPSSVLGLLHSQRRYFENVAALIAHLELHAHEPSSPQQAAAWTKWISDAGTGADAARLFSSTLPPSLTPRQLGVLVRAAGGDVDSLIAECNTFLAVGHSFPTGDNESAALALEHARGQLLAALQLAATDGLHVSAATRADIARALINSTLFKPAVLPDLVFPPGLLDDMVRACGGDPAAAVSLLSYLSASGRQFGGVNSSLLESLRAVSSWGPVAPGDRALVLSYLVSDHCHLWDARKEAAVEAAARLRRAAVDADADAVPGDQRADDHLPVAHGHGEQQLHIADVELDGLIHECQLGDSSTLQPAPTSEPATAASVSSPSPSPSSPSAPLSSSPVAGACLSVLRGLELLGCQFVGFRDLLQTVVTVNALRSNPVALVERRRVIEYLAQPSTRIFHQHSGRLTLTGQQVDIAMVRAGGLAPLLRHLHAFNNEGRAFASFAHLLQAIGLPLHVQHKNDAHSKDNRRASTQRLNAA